MIHKLKQDNEPIEAELEHNLIRIWSKGKNITGLNPTPPEPYIGGYSEQNESWILPSPVDAITLFRELPTLLESGELKLALI